MVSSGEEVGEGNNGGDDDDAVDDDRLAVHMTR
jgi:hypothetical protein